jgi:hypothetical protein
VSHDPGHSTAHEILSALTSMGGKSFHARYPTLDADQEHSTAILTNKYAHPGPTRGWRFGVRGGLVAPKNESHLGKNRCNAPKL